MLDQFVIDASHVLDRTTVIYGESNTGKSCVIKDILFHIKDKIEQIIVIAPSDISNHSYEKSLVPKPCIHYKITSELLDNILQRQTALVAVYERANNLNVLESLFNKIPNSDISPETRSIISKIKAKSSDNIKYSDTLLKVYHKYISAAKQDLLLLNLTPDEKFSLRYFSINPRLTLIFDDCTEYITKFKKHEAFQSLFYRGRWGFLTVIIACHTDKSLDPELKKNAFLSIYTNKTMALTCLTRKSMNLTSEELSNINNIIDEAFDGSVEYQKLVWSRLNNKYYKFCAVVHPNFRFGSDKLWELCDKIAANNENNFNQSNKFFREFTV